jgi:hypothetical protein
MNPAPSTLLQTAFNAEHQALRVIFHAQADRYAHTLALVERVRDGEQITPLAYSLEGSPLDAWPSSSPLQSLSVETRAAGDVALLVGMAGRSHWSASFETFANSTKLLIEHACRVGNEPAWLGCEYNWSESVQVLASSSSQVTLQLNATRILWQATPVEPTPRGIRLAAALPWTAKPVRWQYSLVIDI